MRCARAGRIRQIGPIGLIVAAAASFLATPCAAQDEVRLAPGWREVRWVAVGGGAEPESNQVSLEQDLALVQRIFAGSGRLLFAGGAETQGVQVLKARAPKTPLLQVLGDLFDPRGGREASYRRTNLKPDGPATLERVEQEIERAARQKGETLFLYFATHGEVGDKVRDNRVLLWGGTNLTVGDLAGLLDGAPASRRVAVVSTACFSGGFADLAFEAADPARGASKGDRCGLFASEWNQESSGCDPNPNRRMQESYGVHFLHALRGQDRNGVPLDLVTIDLDGDGRVSLLEAHTRARLFSRSFDVPNSTSERWLRQVAPAEGPEKPVRLPEETAVISALGKRLKVGNEALARRRLEAIETRGASVDAAMSTAEKKEEEAYARLRMVLLERWPVLDDPWHPDFAPTLEQSRAEIEEVLEKSPEATAYRAARAAVDSHAQRLDRARTQAAVHRRLLRAFENRSLASRLRAKGGADWEHYERLLACERSVPSD